MFHRSPRFTSFTLWLALFATGCGDDGGDSKGTSTGGGSGTGATGSGGAGGGSGGGTGGSATGGGSGSGGSAGSGSGTCSDGVQNQNETGVDCGGVCAPCAGSSNIPKPPSNGQYFY